MKRANIKMQKICAFCKHWYDPSNSYIKPIAPKLYQWEYEITAKCMCSEKNRETKSIDWCRFYECKINY